MALTGLAALPIGCGSLLASPLNVATAKPPTPSCMHIRALPVRLWIAAAVGAVILWTLTVTIRTGLLSS